MSCEKCGGKGFYDAPLMMNAGNMGSLKQCCDVKKYSEEVRRRLMGGETVINVKGKPNECLVIPFRKKET